MRPILLLNVGVVIFLVGAATRELNLALRTKAQQVRVNKLATVVTTDPLQGKG